MDDKELIPDGFPYEQSRGKVFQLGHRKVQLVTMVYNHVGDEKIETAPGVFVAKYVVTKKILFDAETNKPVNGVIDAGSHIYHANLDGTVVLSKGEQDE